MATLKRVFTLRMDDEIFDKIGVLATRCNRRSPTATGAEVNGRRAVRQRPA